MQQSLWNLLAAPGTRRRRVNQLTDAVRARSLAIDPLQSADRPGEASVQQGPRQAQHAAKPVRLRPRPMQEVIPVETGRQSLQAHRHIA